VNADPEIVECTSPFGFDAATIDCEQQHFLPLEFVADGTSYYLGRDELVDEIETSLGPLCLLRVMGNRDIPVSPLCLSAFGLECLFVFSVSLVEAG
jgi:hypothetical protein